MDINGIINTIFTQDRTIYTQINLIYNLFNINFISPDTLHKYIYCFTQNFKYLNDTFTIENNSKTIILFYQLINIYCKIKTLKTTQSKDYLYIRIAYFACKIYIFLQNGKFNKLMNDLNSNLIYENIINGTDNILDKTVIKYYFPSLLYDVKNLIIDKKIIYPFMQDFITCYNFCQKIDFKGKESFDKFFLYKTFESNKYKTTSIYNLKRENKPNINYNLLLIYIEDYCSTKNYKEIYSNTIDTCYYNYNYDLQLLNNNKNSTKLILYDFHIKSLEHNWIKTQFKWDKSSIHENECSNIIFLMNTLCYFLLGNNYYVTENRINCFEPISQVIPKISIKTLNYLFQYLNKIKLNSSDFYLLREFNYTNLLLKKALIINCLTNNRNELTYDGQLTFTNIHHISADINKFKTEDNYKNYITKVSELGQFTPSNYFANIYYLFRYTFIDEYINISIKNYIHNNFFILFNLLPNNYYKYIPYLFIFYVITHKIDYNSNRLITIKIIINYFNKLKTTSNTAGSLYEPKITFINDTENDNINFIKDIPLYNTIINDSTQFFNDFIQLKNTDCYLFKFENIDIKSYFTYTKEFIVDNEIMELIQLLFNEPNKFNLNLIINFLNYIIPSKRDNLPLELASNVRDINNTINTNSTEIFKYKLKLLYFILQYTFVYNGIFYNPLIDPEITSTFNIIFGNQANFNNFITANYGILNNTLKKDVFWDNFTKLFKTGEIYGSLKNINSKHLNNKIQFINNELYTKYYKIINNILTNNIFISVNTFTLLEIIIFIDYIIESYYKYKINYFKFNKGSLIEDNEYQNSELYKSFDSDLKNKFDTKVNEFQINIKSKLSSPYIFIITPFILKYKSGKHKIQYDEVFLDNHELYKDFLNLSSEYYEIFMPSLEYDLFEFLLKDFIKNEELSNYSLLKEEIKVLKKELNKKTKLSIEEQLTKKSLNLHALQKSIKPLINNINTLITHNKIYYINNKYYQDKFNSQLFKELHTKYVICIGLLYILDNLII